MLSWTWLGGAMILNLVVATAQRRRTTYLLGLIVWVLAVSLVQGGQAGGNVVQTAMTGYPVVFTLGSLFHQLYDAALR